MPVVTTPEELVAARENVKSARDQLLDDYKRVMDTAPGRRVIWQILSDAKIFHPCFTGSSSTFYNEGRREFGLKVLALCHTADKALYQRMFNENADFTKHTTPGE